MIVLNIGNKPHYNRNAHAAGKDRQALLLRFCSLQALEAGLSRSNAPPNTQ